MTDAAGAAAAAAGVPEEVAALSALPALPGPDLSGPELEASYKVCAGEACSPA